ncbi:hypothetical protein [Commensalibacter communis]|uniref:hypothetical protein n=1 Tax=Commensalibacter communis TaxID=2972786 RepID=UPI00232DD26E|nr:hypothetical protein [Commensalibacter communis]
MENTFRWILMLALGKSEAINKFPNTSNAVLRAMLWWVASIFIISLVTCFILSFSLSNNTGIVKFFIAVFLYKFCCLLLAAVFIHLCAILLNKEDNWKKTVTAFYWCDWVPSVAYVAIFMIVGLFFEVKI